MAIKCSSCNKKINKNSEYCMYCGSQIRKEIEIKEYKQPYQESKLESNVENYNVLTRKQKSKYGILKYILLSCILIVGIIVFMFISDLMKYNQASNYMYKNEYDKAITTFKQLGDFKDSKDKLKETIYNKITYEMGSNRYYDNVDDKIKDKILLEQELKGLGNYKDSLMYLKNIQNDLANLYFENGNLEEAEKYYELVKDSYDVKYNLECINILSKFQGKWRCVNGNDSGMKIQGREIKVYWFENGRVSSVWNCNIPLTSVKKDRVNVIEMRKIDSTNHDLYTLTYDNSKLLWSLFDDFNLEYEKGDFTEEMIEEPQIGMTADEVEHSTWGKPKKINKSTYSWGVREQWVYDGDKYIYLEDGVVTSISE